MAQINIESNGLCGKISVDGQQVKGVTRIAMEMTGGTMPIVTLELAAFQNDVEFSDARLKIGGIEAPEALERAMLVYLQAKYAMREAVATSSGSPSLTASATDGERNGRMTWLPGA